MIIACGYKKRAGKDTFFKYTKEFFEGKREVHRVASADFLKDEVYDLLLKPNGLPYEMINASDTKEVIRPFLQWYATEFKRNPVFNGNPNHFIDKSIEKIRKLKTEDPNCVVVLTDCHFLNELNAMRDMGAHCIRIERKLSEQSGDMHLSEVELDAYHHLFHYTAFNNTTEADYKDKVRIILAHLNTLDV